ncbi:RNA polymerase sigma factor [Tunicatimonas pelagia]|uniref:RNA polymerase sigma factor n=1 Tax=Tunicatimonas pelagia TaxID=931531 RepID=UPI0026662B5D|nr:sigma-70 family RNA polymerase sigma factor [Tunicatimonas pelagia]WKN44539.1 sigma-70 family RNA polymerase sigma factor [Tunicatimonas pelagia]
MQSRFLHIDDTKTWNAFKSGNQAAFAYIYQAYFQPLYNYGRKFSSDDAIIGDTLQQLFTELWQRRKRLGSTNQIRNYLYKSFRRALLRNLAKKEKAEQSSIQIPFLVCLSHEAHLIQQQHTAEQLNHLEQALAQLTEKQREVIYLKFYDGLTYAEISEVMGISSAQAYDYMYKALKALRKNIKDSGNYNELTSSALVLFFVVNSHSFF